MYDTHIYTYTYTLTHIYTCILTFNIMDKQNNTSLTKLTEISDRSEHFTNRSEMHVRCPYFVLIDILHEL